METTVTDNNFLVAKITLTDDVIDTLVKRITERMDLNQIIDDQVEYYMNNAFDINDYSGDIDLYEIKRNLIDEVIETIKERLE